MSKSSSDHSIHNEPHIWGETHRPGRSEARAERILSRSKPTESGRLDQSVWDEPGVMGKPPPGALTYENWLAKGRERTGILRSCAWAIAVALAAGPWAILGAFVGTYSYGRADVAGVLGLTIIAPVIEEMMKIAATLYVVERRPFLFQSRAQIVICVIAGGLVFACIENVFYLKVYISDPSAAIIYWRWTVCVFLHMGCSLIAGLGLIRIWQDVWRRRARARIHLAFPYLVIAMVVHGTYNGFALVWSMMEHM